MKPGHIDKVHAAHIIKPTLLRIYQKCIYDPITLEEHLKKQKPGLTLIKT